MKASVDAFATSYTSGKDQKADLAAFKSLESGLNSFAQALMASDSPAPAGDASTVPAGVPMPMPMPLPHGGPGLNVVGMGLLTGPALTKDEVTTLKTAVDTFAAAYTAGTDAAADKAASDALGTALGTLVSDRWQNMTPPDVKGAPVVMTALPAVPSDTAAPVSAAALQASTPVVPAGVVSRPRFVAGPLVAPNASLPGRLASTLAALRTANLFSTTTSRISRV
ncbi:MAG: hypothetical protein U0835_07655 [Isosphaeraceae bacterium]